MNQARATLFEVRHKHGSTYVTVLDDHTMVPWRTLSIEEYIRYEQDLFRGVIPQSRIEDEIFRLCVQDEAYVRRMNYSKAGLVSTVVQNIWDYSSYTDLDTLNNDINEARMLLQSGPSRVLHECVQIVCRVFPYTPDQVYAMDYRTLLFRVAQAEDQLMKAGMKEPISFIALDTNKKTKKKKFMDLNPKVDAKEIWDRQVATRKKPTPSPVATPDKWWKVSPVLEAPHGHNIDFNLERAEHDTFGVHGHDKHDLHINRAKMLQDTIPIYADLIAELQKRREKSRKDGK
jgi:hypothetical protein